jgi:membrane protein YdbS with pleckstrin-like domain
MRRLQSCAPCALISRQDAMPEATVSERFRGWLMRVLRVPVEPAPPPGDPALVRTFRAAPSYFRYSVAAWALKQLSALFGLLFGYYFFRNFVFFRGFGYGWIGIIELIAVAAFIAQLPFSFALLRLDFEMRWYMLSDRSLRIREGILSVHERTMTFANIQNISIRQNPLQRIFGISTVVVRAAGGGSATGEKGGGGTRSHEATFEGVDNAEEIRNVIRERIRMHRDAGLGDPDDALMATPATDGASFGSAIAAAQRLLSEAALLRSAVG